MSNIMLEVEFRGQAPSVTEFCDCSINQQCTTSTERDGMDIMHVHVECNLCDNEADYTYERQDDGLWVMVDD